jgi:predicted porin
MQGQNMKKQSSWWKNTLVCGTGLACGTAAHAESSVIIYGVADAGLEHISHQKTAQGTSASVWQLSSGNRVNSRLGFRGSEDLGDGLRAVFTLEGGMDMSTGATLQSGANKTPRLFGRQAFVGLESDRLGSLMLGRQITPMYRFSLALDPLNYSSYGLSAQDSQFVGRADKAVSYLKKAGPVEFNAMYSFGYDALNAGNVSLPVPDNFRVGKQYNLAARYLQGPANLTVSFERRQGLTIATGTKNESRYLAGGTYKIGRATLYGGYELLLNGLTPTQTRSMVYGGTRYRITPALDLSAAAYYHAYRDIEGHALSLGLNADYWFSKRTAVYTNVTQVVNAGKAALGVAGTASPALPGVNQLGVASGIVHTF